MADILSVFLFFVYTWGFGFTVTSFAKKQENFLERHLMNIGIGLGALIAFGLILNFIKIKLHWQIFLAASLAYPLYYLIRNFKGIISNIKSPKLKITKYSLSIFAMLVIFFVSLYIYEKGAFAYQFLEDDDPWSHSLSAKYVSIEKKLTAEKPLFHFIDPYPPAYNLLMGLMHQTNDSIYWTLKFFNALIISLSIIFFYFFVKELTGSYGKALFSSFVLASLPSYLSHFIWSLALSMVLYPISFYCIEKIKHDKKWFVPSIFVIAAALTTSPSHSFYFALLLGVYMIVKVIAEKKILIYEAIASLGGLSLSLIVWWIPAIIKFGFTGMLNSLGMRLGAGNTLLSVDGTGDMIYLFRDFVFAKHVNNTITNPFGIGLVVSILLLIGIIAVYYKIFSASKNIPPKWKKAAYFFEGTSLALLFFGIIRYSGSSKPKTEVIMILFSLLLLTILFIILSFSKHIESSYNWIGIILSWLILTFYAVNGVLFPYKVSAFRVWMILSIPVAVLSSYGLWFLMGFVKKIKIAVVIMVLLVLTGIVFTSGYYKYKINTSQWPPGGFWVILKDNNGRPISPELGGYIQFKDSIPAGARVFTFSNDAAIIGFDKFICHWCDDERDFKKTGFNSSASDIAEWLRKKNYEYIVIDGETAKKYGANQTIYKLQEFANSRRFNVKAQTPPEYGVYGFFLFKVN